MTDHTHEHSAICATRNIASVRRYIKAADCPTCQIFDAGYEAGFRNGSGDDNNVIIRFDGGKP